jgi:hypothetical protein
MLRAPLRSGAPAAALPLHIAGASSYQFLSGTNLVILCITKLKSNTMKKLIFASAFAFIAVGISSCGTSSGSSTTTEYTILSSEWTANGSSGNSNFLYYNSHVLTSITQSIVDNGYVLAYVKLVGSSTQYSPLPYYETNSGYQVMYGYQYETGKILVTRKDSDLNTIPPSGSITIKVVAVATKDMELLNGVNTNNYFEVKDALKLQQ